MKVNNYQLIVLCFIGMALIFPGLTFSNGKNPEVLRSPDGRYEARKVGSHPDVHYQVREIGTGRVKLTTCAEFDTLNDVKAGTFSPDSRKFAAAYHYGHEGGYTWTGIWGIETGSFLCSDKRRGWIRIIPASVFRCE